MCSKRWDSSVEQHGSVVSNSMPIDVAARITFSVRAFSFPPAFPHNALVLLNMKTSKLHPLRVEMICQFIVRLTDECSCGRRIYLFKERLYQHAQHIVSVC